MCLGMPGQVKSIDGGIAVVDFWGARKSVRLDEAAEAVRAGDYVIEHDGAVVRVIPPQDVADTLALYEVLLLDHAEEMELA